MNIRLGFALLGFLFPPLNASAQQVGSEVPVDTVFAFNRICYSQVPNVQNIRKMATELFWEPVEKADLNPFAATGREEIIEGWEVQIGERFYRLGLTQGSVSDKVKEDLPEFANGKTTSCTMVLDGQDNNADLANKMRELAGKDPVTKDVSDGDLLTTTWAGGNDDVKVLLVLSAAAEHKEGGLLNVTVITK